MKWYDLDFGKKNKKQLHFNIFYSQRKMYHQIKGTTSNFHLPIKKSYGVDESSLLTLLRR